MSQASVVLFSSVFRSQKGLDQVLSWYDRMLESCPIPYESQRIETSFGETHVLSVGDPKAPPMLLLHGMNTNAMGMKRFWLHLSKSFRVILPDIIGQPGKSAYVRPPREGDGYGRWLAEVLDGLSLEKVSMMGISFGAWVILKLARFAPERLEKAVLLVPAGLAPVRLRTQLHFARRVPPYVIAPNEHRLFKLIGPLFSPGANPERDLVELLGIAFRYVKAKPAPFKVMTQEQLSHVTAPMLVMAGEKDVFYRHQELLTHAKKVLPKGSAFELLQGQGHIFFDAALAKVCQRTATFLQEPVIT